MRTLKEKGGGLFQNVKAFFTRKKTKANSPKRHKNSLVQRVKGKLKGLNKPPTSAPTQYPVTKYPMFKGNERRNTKVIQAEMNQKKQNAEKFQDKTITLDIDTQTKAPPTEEAKRDRPQDIARMTLPIENVRDGMRRVYLFLYNKMRATQGLPLSPNPVYLSDSEFSELVYFVRNFKLQNYPDTMKQKMTFDEYQEYTSDLLDRVAETIFGTSYLNLREEISNAEAKNHVFPSLADPSKLQFGEKYGGELGRYSPILFSSVRRADHVADTMKNLCFYDVYSDKDAPILFSLKDPYCICVFGGMNHFARATSVDKKSMCSHYFVADPKYHPFEFKLDNAMSAEYIQAPRFTTTSYVVDAFKEQGVITMDEDLFKLLQKEAPELVELAKVFLVTADKFKHLKLYDHFMVLTEKALPEGLVTTYKDPLQLSVVRRAFDEDRQFLLCDPYTAYCTKKKNRLLWSEAFGIKTTPTKGKYWNLNFDVYEFLRDVEKLFLDFCQYQLVLGKYLDFTQNTKQSAEHNLKKASELYKVSFKDTKFLQQMYSVGSGEAIFGEFKKIQATLITYDTPIETLEDVMALIRKINPSWRAARNLFEPAARPLMPAARPVVQAAPRGTLRLAQVAPQTLPPPLPSSPAASETLSSLGSNEESPLPPPPPPPLLSSEPPEDQIAKARKRIRDINTELAKALPVYEATRKKHSLRANNTNNVMLARYNKLIKKPTGARTRSEIEFLKNYSRILRNFSMQRSILMQDRQQQVDLLARLGATSV